LHFDRIEERSMPGPLGLPLSLPALVGKLGPVKDLDAAGLRRLVSALQGGVGQEFRQVIERQVKNPGRIVFEFLSGRRTTFETPGFAGRTAKLRPTYQGPQLDQFNPIASGAVVLRNGVLSLGAIMRGPIDRPEPVRYVWGFNLGRGAINPFPEVPQIQADTLVTVERAGAALPRVFVTDLTTGQSTDIQPRMLKIEGPTLRLRVNPADLPGGAIPTSTTYAFWTQSGDGGLPRVGQFVPDHNLRVGRLMR
jgi:hypothetical protein